MTKCTANRNPRTRGDNRFGALVVGTGVCVAAATCLLPATAHACEPTTVCLFWDANFADSGVGEDYLTNSLVPASGARILLMRPPPELPISTSLDGEGCVTFETQFSYGHKALVYADAVVGGVRLRPAVMGGTGQNEPVIDQTFFWEIHMHGLEADGLAYGSISNEVSVDDADIQARMLPIIASATATLQRFEDLGVLPPNLAADETLFLAYRPVFGNARCACEGGSPSRLEIGPDSFDEKFLVAHELGHWLQAKWSGIGVGARDYDYPVLPGEDVPTPAPQPLDEPCRFVIRQAMDADMNNIASDGGFHGIRSAEWSSGGLVEGFAHFIAGVAWNDFENEAGIYRYYKDINTDPLNGVPSYQDFVDGGSRVALEGGEGAATVGGANRWVANMCPNDWNSGVVADEVTSGMDWMRFWWRFLSDQAEPQPTLSEILELIVLVQENDPWIADQVWPQLSGGAEATIFDQRFNDIALEQGVFNDQ